MPQVSPVEFDGYCIISRPQSDADSAVFESNLLNPTGFNKQTRYMNAKLPFVLSLAGALMPISAAMGQGRRGGGASVSRSSGGTRSAPQFRGASFRGAAFRGGGAPVQRYNWGAPRFNHF